MSPITRPQWNVVGFAKYVRTYARTYDADNRLLTEKLNGATQITHTYDGTGRLGLLSMTTDITGRVITYGYTARNQIASIAEPAGTAAYTYDNDQNLIDYTDENGVVTNTSDLDDNDRLTYISEKNSAGSLLLANTLSYNADGKIVQAADGSGDVTTYGYDGYLHLNSEVRTGSNTYSRTYVVDGEGDRTSMDDSGIITTLTYSADDQLQSDPGGYRTYTYDGNGNQTGFTQTGEVPATYDYGPENELTAIVYGDGDGTVNFAYDATGRQVARAFGGTTTAYYYDGDKVIADLTGSTWTQDTWGPNGQVRRGTEYALYDGIGSSWGQTNSADAVTQSIVFDAFGRPQAITGYSPDPFEFKSEYGYRADGDGSITGQGIYKVGARYYDPLFGRFISRDSDLGQAAYAYCSADPLDNVDPTGRWALGINLGVMGQFFFPGAGTSVSLELGNDGASLNYSYDSVFGAGIGGSAGLSFSFSTTADASFTGVTTFDNNFAFLGWGSGGSVEWPTYGPPTSISISLPCFWGVTYGGGFGSESGTTYSIGTKW